jgi:hypothetical protein
MSKEAKEVDGSNVVQMPIQPMGEFTPRERAKLREMMATFEKVTHACPVARKIAAPDD